MTVSRGSSVSTVTRLRGGRSGFDSRLRLGFSLFTTASTLTGAHQACYPMGIEGSFPGVKRPEVHLITHLHVVPNLRMRGAIPPLTQYVLRHYVVLS